MKHKELLLLLLVPLFTISSPPEPPRKISKLEEVNQEIRDALSKWALQEMIEKQEIEKAKRLKQQKQKWVIGGIGFITTMIPLVTAIIEMTKDEVCNEPAQNELSTSFNITW